MRILFILLVGLAASGASVARAEGDLDRGGYIATDEANIEIVRPHKGRVIQTPEGFLRIEDGPDLDKTPGLGTFTTYRASSDPGDPTGTGGGREDPRLARSGPDDPGVARASARRTAGKGPDRVSLRPDGLVDTTAPAPGTDPCRSQRGRYLRRLLEMSGVKVDQALELLDGLAGPGAAPGNVLVSGYVFPGVDPLKPLAWDQELRSLGRDLAACQAGTATARPRR